jgi:hypothetical protein
MSLAVGTGNRLGHLSKDRFRIRRGLAVIFESDGVIFVWGSWNKKLSGRDGPTALVPVVRQLDRWRSLSEVSAATGLDGGVAAAVLHTLDERNLLEHESYEEPRRDAPTALVSFLSVVTGFGAGARGTRATLEALSKTLIVVAAPPAAVAEAACEVLRDSGVGLVVSGPQADLPGRQDLAGYTRRLAVVLDDYGEIAAERAAELLSTGVDGTGIPVLRYYVDNSTVEVGPVFFPGKRSAEQPCFRCARVRGELPPLRTGELEVPLLQLGSAEVAREAMAILGLAGEVTSVRTIQRTDWPLLKTKVYLAVPNTDCDTCYPVRYCDEDTGDCTRTGGPADVYEYEVQLSPREAENAGPIQAPSYRDEVLDALAVDPVYESSPRIPLPELPAERRASHFHGEVHRDRLEVLADLLQRSAGKRTAGDSRRWAASGGNRGSVQLYMISEASVLGWPRGSIFKYDGESHELLLARNPLSDYDLSLLSAHTENFGTWTIIVTVSLARLYGRYGNFSARLGLLDAGCALAQLSALAAVHNLEMRLSTSWPGHLAKVLEIEAERGEMIAAIAEFREAG